MEQNIFLPRIDMFSTIFLIPSGNYILSDAMGKEKLGVVGRVRVLDSQARVSLYKLGFRPRFQVPRPTTSLPGYIAHIIMCLYCFSVFRILSYYVCISPWLANFRGNRNLSRLHESSINFPLAAHRVSSKVLKSA